MHAYQCGDLSLQGGEKEAGKLAVSRKRYTRGGGTMARRKRRLCSGEKRDTAPLLSMLPTSRTMTVEEVELQIKALLESICEVGVAIGGRGQE